MVPCNIYKNLQSPQRWNFIINISDIYKLLEDATGFKPETQTKIYASVFIGASLWVGNWALGRGFVQHAEDPRTVYRWRRTSSYVATVIGLMLVGRIWFEGIQSIATFLGLFSAGLAFALQAPIVNLAGWAFILWRRPFELGDRIEIGNLRGDVIDQRLFVFTLMELGAWVDADQSTGRVTFVPNGKVFTDAVSNYNKGFRYIWNELPVMVTFESDWRKAMDILEKIAVARSVHLTHKAESYVRKAAQKMMINFNKLTPKVYVSVKDSGVLLTIRVLCEPQKRRDMSEEIWKDILDEFALCDDVDFAYPSQRFYINRSEGKAGTKPDRVDKRISELVRQRQSDSENDDPHMQGVD